MIQVLSSLSVLSPLGIVDPHFFQLREPWASLIAMGSSGSLIWIEMRADFAWLLVILDVEIFRVGIIGCGVALDDLDVDAEGL
jgi:hypothetical protein